MPIYNNPAIGQAFSNIAQLFAPPSGSDLAGYAAAKAKNEEASRLAALYANPTDPLASKRSALLGIQTFGATPEGFGMEDATKRYGIDVGAKSAAEVARINGESELAKLYATPVTVAENATTYVPGSTSKATGLPGVLRGNINVGEGEITTTPDGQVFRGAPKPLTNEQVIGAVTQSLPAVDQRAIAMRDVKPTNIVGPNGVPQIVSTTEAIDKSAQPYFDTTDKALVEGTAQVGGKVVQVFRKPNELVYRTADGQPIPADVQVFERAKPTGTNEQIGMKPTEFADKNAIFYNRAAPASANMNKAVSEGYMPSSKDFELIMGGIGDAMPMSLSNQLVSAEGRQFYNDAMNFMMSVLRPDTGAAFGKEEFQSYARVFIPLPGDDPATVQRKALARDTALAALQGTSRGAADQITKLILSNGLPIPEEMQKRLAANQKLMNSSAPAPAAPSAPTAAPAAGPAAAPAAAPPPAAPAVTPPDGAVMMLKANPSMRELFDQKYGPGAAAFYLGGQ